METINQATIPALQTIAKSSKVAKEVFAALAARERSAARSDIDAILREISPKLSGNVDYEEYLDIWRDLEKKGAGILVHGRKGNPNRFAWAVDLKSLGRLSLVTNSEPPKSKAPVPLVKPAPTKEMKTEEPATNTVTFVIPASVPMQEIMALLTLGAQLTSKPIETKKSDDK